MAEPQGSLDGAASAWKCTDANCGMELPGSMTGMRFCPRCNLKKQIQLEKGISLDSKTKLNEREEPTPITQSIPKDSVQGEGSPALTPGVADTAMKSTEDGINFPTQETGTPGDVKDQVGATLVTGNDKKDCDADKSAVVAKTHNNCNRSGDDTPKLLQVFGDTEVTQESGANNSVESQKNQKEKQSVLKIEPEKECDQQTEAKQESGASNTVRTQKNQEDKVLKKEQEKKCDQQKKEEKERKIKEKRRERAEKRKIENQQREEEKTKKFKENQEERQRVIKERQERREQQEDRKRNAHTVDTAHDPLQMKVDGPNDNDVTEKKNGGGGSQGDGDGKTDSEEV